MHPKYAELIKEELAEADATTTDFRGRALTIVTTSAGLVTLLSGLIAVAAGTKDKWRFPGDAHGPLYVALGLYVSAAIVALLIHLPREMQRATNEALEELLDADDDDEQAVRAVAELQLTTLKSVRKLNGGRATLLFGAITAEIAAIAATGLTALRVITSL